MSDFEAEELLPQLEITTVESSAPMGEVLLDDSTDKRLGQRIKCLEKYFSLLAKPISFKDFCRELMVVAMECLPCEAASLLEVDPSKSFLFFRTSAGRCSDKVQNFQVPIGQGIAGSVATTKTYLLIDRANENRLHLKSIGDAVGFKAENMLALPLLIRGEIFGVFELLNRNGLDGFSQDDVDFALSIAEWMSKAIEVRMMINYQNQKKNEEGMAPKAA